MIYRTHWLQRLEYKFGRYAIHNLMTLIVGGMAVVFFMDMFSPVPLTSLLAFNQAAIFRGEFWRLISFVFIPPRSSMLFILFSLYFYWLLGSTLEQEWGAFKFNAFYLCGIIGTILAGLLTGYATNYYVNMTLFFAFALLYPDFQLLLFLVLPIKIKYLAYFNAAYFLYMLILSAWPGRIALLLSILNLVVFFGHSAKNRLEQIYRREKWKRSMRR